MARAPLMAPPLRAARAAAALLLALLPLLARAHVPFFEDELLNRGQAADWTLDAPFEIQLGEGELASSGAQTVMQLPACSRARPVACDAHPYRRLFP